MIRKIAIVFVWALALILPLYLNRATSQAETDPKAITVFAWSDIILDDVVEAFEREHNVRVNVNYFSSNEELMVKLNKTEGRGYDLIIPSDYAVKLLTDDGLLQPIDTSKITRFEEISPFLKGHPFDPNNTYSVPYTFEVFGYIYDPAYFHNTPFSSTWDTLFTDQGFKIAMTNDPVEAYLFAGAYLFPGISSLSPSQINEIEELLTKQRNNVEAYGAMRSDYFVSMKNCPMAITSSSYALLAQSQFPFVEFSIVSPNSFLTIENFAIPKPSTKTELTYRFINYIIEPKNFAAAIEEYYLFPSTPKALDEVSSFPCRCFLPIYQSVASSKTSFRLMYNATDEQRMRLFWTRMKGL